MAGFSLNQVSDIKITDSKIYGVHAEKVKKKDIQYSIQINKSHLVR